MSVVQRITDVGFYYKATGEEIGPFTVEQEASAIFDDELAVKLGVEAKQVLLARQRELLRLVSFEEVAEVLGSTVRHDLATKLILFAACLLTGTEEDQINISMSGESSGGKSHNALEITAYFPKDILIIIATASPTAFFHDQGQWDSEQHVLRVDLKGKILVFLDQPHFTLMERLRPLLSHDRNSLLYKITDKSKGGALRTKNVLVLGYPTVIFCAAKLSMDEQERTRVLILSPETTPAKLTETIQLKIAKDTDREQWQKWIDSHPRRRWLKNRIQQLQNANIKQVIIPNQTAIYNKFIAMHPRLNPRHQRDIGRILGLIKSHALLNWTHRETPTPGSIVATDEDIEAGFNLYKLIAKANELGLSPQVWEIYQNVIQPLLVSEGVPRQRILNRYYEVYGRPLDETKLRKEIVPSLQAAGLIIEEPDPADKRRMLILPSTQSIPITIYTQETIGETTGDTHP